MSLASIDNALHQKLISWDDVAQLQTRAPYRLRELLSRADARAESGQETLLRLIVEKTGLACEPQVTFSGIGRVDLLVADCLVLEADSRTYHDSWEAHVRDRGRDLALARLGYACLRPAYQHTVYHPHEVRAAISRLVDQQRREITARGGHRVGASGRR